MSFSPSWGKQTLLIMSSFKEPCVAGDAAWLQGVCLACTRPWVWSPVPSKQGCMCLWSQHPPDQNTKVILSFMANVRPAWDTGGSKQTNKAKVLGWKSLASSCAGPSETPPYQSWLCCVCTEQPRGNAAQFSGRGSKVLQTLLPNLSLLLGNQHLMK